MGRNNKIFLDELGSNSLLYNLNSAKHEGNLPNSQNINYSKVLGKELVYFDIKNDSHKELIEFLEKNEVNIIPVISSRTDLKVIGSVQDNNIKELTQEELKQTILKNANKAFNEEQQLELDSLVEKSYRSQLSKQNVLGNIKSMKHDILIDDRIENLQSFDKKNKP